MPRKTISEPVFDTQRNRWRVTVPESLSECGKRVRSWHKTRESARKYIAKLTANEEEPAAVIPPMLAMKADEARAILEPFGLDLVEAAKELSQALTTLAGKGTLQQSAQAYRAQYEARNASKQLGEAVTLYLESREDLRDSTQKSYNYTLGNVLKPLHGKMMADIRTADLEKILKNKGTTARAMHLRNLGTFWRWASAPPRSWTDVDTVKAIEKPRVSNDTDIKILTTADVKALLHAAEAEGPAAAVAFAVAIFGGVRMAELERLKWGDIRGGYIEIGRAIAKKHSRRLIPICPTLKAWIKATRGEASKADQIVPANWTDVSKSVRRRAGWEVAARLLEKQVKEGKLDKIPEPTRGKWPTNACRHTCASVQVAIGTPLDDLIFKFGHSGGHDLLRRHYVHRMTRKEALAILAIGPGGSKVPGIHAA